MFKKFDFLRVYCILIGQLTRPGRPFHRFIISYRISNNRSSTFTPTFQVGGYCHWSQLPEPGLPGHSPAGQRCAETQHQKGAGYCREWLLSVPKLFVNEIFGLFLAHLALCAKVSFCDHQLSVVHRPSSVVHRPSSIVVVRCQNLLLKNHWTEFNQISHEASLGYSLSSLFKSWWYL